MHYVVVQKGAAPPGADQLRRAFKCLKRLTDLDAAKMARQACGILLKHLSLDEATLVQRALEAEGVPAEAVPEPQLPKLPDAKCVRRIELQPQAMMIYDPLGRAVPMPWSQIVLISAGVVRHFGVSQSVTQEWVHRDYIVVAFDHLETDVRHTVHETLKLVVEIFLAGAAVRFQIEAEHFLFGYVFQRPGLDLPQKAGLLVALLAKNAPQARLNLGAMALRDHPDRPALYPSKAALEDESVWNLWRLATGVALPPSDAPPGKAVAG